MAALAEARDSKTIVEMSMDIIEAYYVVAADLERNGRHYLSTAEHLSRIADALSEARMREKSLPDVEATKPSE